MAGRRRRAVGRAAAAGSNRARRLVGYGWPRLGSEANPVVLVSTFGRLCRSPGAISSIRHWLYMGTPRSGELGPGGRALCISRPVLSVAIERTNQGN